MGCLVALICILLLGAGRPDLAFFALIISLVVWFFARLLNLDDW